ncbi:TIMELESS domain-containing protein, partial [Haematococcus lacustris]
GLAYYQHNSAATNAAVFAVLWRIASPDGLNLEPLLYQLSVLRQFHKLLADKAIRAKDRVKEFHMMDGVAGMCFLDLMFWKTAQ